MKAKIVNWSLGKKLIVAEALLVLVLLSIFSLYVGSYCGNLMEKSTITDLKHQVSLVKSMLDVYDHSVTQSTEKFANVFTSYYPDRFQLDPRRTVKIGTVDTPVLLHGTRVINLDFDTIDRFTKMTGAVATVFAKSGDDFVRITTSVKKQDGSRAIGTTLGKNHPAYNSLIKGESYLGRANLFGRDYSTKYLPIKGGGGDVIGLLFVGMDTTDALNFMKEQIKAIKIGQTGYLYALNAAEGDQQGTLVIHPVEEGKNILASKAADGREFIKEMIKNREGVTHYYWQNKGESAPREKMVAYAFFDDWKLLIAAGAYEEELSADVRTLYVVLFAATVLIILIMVGILNYAATRMVIKPLREAVDFAGVVAGGDLTRSVHARSNDEIGTLGNSLNQMVISLRSMIGKIRSTSDQVASAASEISSGSAQLTRAAHSQSSAAEETSSTMVQMVASIQTVATNTDSLASNVDEVSSSVQELGASSEQVSKSAEVMASSVAETSATIEQMTVSIDRVAQSAEELASSVAETSSTVEQMTVSIDQVAGNSQELQQVATDTAATVEQLAISIREAAKNIESADDVAKAAAKEGSAGQEAVQQALAAMERVGSVIDKTALSIDNLGKRSEEIGSIVKVINEIADQTNLLALNAAIEAARAGDAGRGFAVVAEEVRKLAERSVNATKEIGEVIKQVQADTSDSVKYGELASREAQASMELSGAAGNALANIVKSIEQTSALMTEIAMMTGEQANASGQVLKSVERMTQATVQVASAAREQAQGGKQIRIAVEKMNTITQEVTGATREQAQGSKQIRIAVENMNHVTQQVNIATKEQALSARQIVEAVNSMNTMTLSVANATAEQKKGGEMVVQAVETISDSSRDNLASVEQLSRSAQGLSQQAIDLAAMVAAFKVA
jgi:methyl-accepting chemotaxis protein